MVIIMYESNENVIVILCIINDIQWLLILKWYY